jgi:hypothetical protein
MNKELLKKLKKEMPEETGMPEMEISMEMPGKGPKGKSPVAAPSEGPELEISMEGEEPGMEEEMAMEGEAEPMDLTAASDEDLLAEVKKRGLSV